jgi:hypothetical protein
LDLDLASATQAQKAALGWACEMTSLSQAARRLPGGTVKWLDFDRFLEDPKVHLCDVAGHFGLGADEASLRAIAEGPLMGRYSKAPEFEYSADLRREILKESRWTHGRAIRDALGWLRMIAERYPAVADAIRKAAGEAA